MKTRVKRWLEQTRAMGWFWQSRLRDCSVGMRRERTYRESMTSYIAEGPWNGESWWQLFLPLVCIFVMHPLPLVCIFVMHPFISREWVKVAQLCMTLCNPMDVHGILQARILFLLQNLPHPGIEPRSPALQVDSLPAEPRCDLIRFLVLFTIRRVKRDVGMIQICLWRQSDPQERRWWEWTSLPGWDVTVIDVMTLGGINEQLPCKMALTFYRVWVSFFIHQHTYMLLSIWFRAAFFPSGSLYSKSDSLLRSYLRILWPGSSLALPVSVW